jgi:hypothetical protein
MFLFKPGGQRKQKETDLAIGGKNEKKLLHDAENRLRKLCPGLSRQTAPAIFTRPGTGRGRSACAAAAELIVSSAIVQEMFTLQTKKLLE